MRVMRDWQVIPHVRIIEQFFEHPMFIHAFVERGREFLDKNAYDHILFSYHGLPERQIRKASVSGYCQLGDKCCSVLHDKNRYCYRAQCFATTRLLVKGLGLKEGTYSTSFQSRLGKDPWIKPYTDEVIKGLAARGVKRLLVFSPAFVADCLETTVEIDSEYKHVFLGAGGERLDMVPSLNDHPAWIRCLKTMVEN
jgi:ferrochelatase